MSNSYFFGLMSSSKSLSESISAMISENAILGAASCSVTAYEVILGPEWMLKPGALLIEALEHYVNGSDAKCAKFSEDSVNDYNQFISMFGTGRISQGVVGGVAQLFFASASVVTDVIAYGDLGIQASGSLLDVVAAAGGASGHADVNAAFNTSLVFGTSRTLGGNMSPFGRSDQWQNWEQSVFENPAIVTLQTSNLSSLIATYDKSCGEELYKAEVNHHLRAYLQDELIPILKLIQTYIAAEFWPHCVYGSAAASCAEMQVKADAASLQTEVEKALSNNPITTFVQAALLSAKAVALALRVPRLPPSAKPQDWNTIHSADIPSAAFCGITTTQVGFETDVGNQVVSVAPGPAAASGGFLKWTFSSGPNYGYGGSGCITYPSSANRGISVATYSLNGVTNQNLGAHWLCVITTIQFGFNSCVGNGVVTLTRVNGEWVYSTTLRPLDYGSAACLSTPPDGVPTDISEYHVTGGTVLGKHWLCVINQIQFGHETHIGNQYATLSQDASGTWTGIGDFGDNGGSAVCIG